MLISGNATDSQLRMLSLFEFLNGKVLVSDGIEGTLSYEYRTIKYPRVCGSHSLYWHPTEQGKKTEAYRNTKRIMGDDWVSDLTDSEELGDIAIALGYDYLNGCAA